MSAVSTPRFAVTEPPHASSRTGDPVRAWKWLGWFALILALAGLGDWLLAWVPMRFGSPEWEFGTIVSTFSGLPLITMGFAGLLASAVARGIRWQVMSVSLVVLLFATWVLLAFVIFLLDIPIALGAVQGVARIGIIKAIAKTSMLAVLFSAVYVVAAVSALRFARRMRSA
jgi:hypothetical protein